MSVLSHDHPDGAHAGPSGSHGSRAGGPLVSVVTPCLDPGERLARCLRSVAAQTYPLVEHVVVDGGSTDGTPGRLAAAGVRWISEPDAGQAQAINKGIGLATGSILTWLNADDVLVPDAVERAVSALGRSPGPGLVYGDCRVVTNGRGVLTWRAPRRLGLAAFLEGSPIPQPGSFVARWALDRAGPLDESFDLAMDVDLWLRLLAAGVGTRRLGGVVSVFELHPGSKTGSVPGELFHEENARAFLRAGLSRHAALSVGRAAATGAVEAGRVPAARLEAAIRSAQEDGSRSEPPLPPRAIRAAAVAEAAVIETRTSLAGLRHLRSVDPWLEPATRRRLWSATRRGIPQTARRVLRRLPRDGRRQGGRAAAAP